MVFLVQMSVRCGLGTLMSSEHYTGGVHKKGITQVISNETSLSAQQIIANTLFVHSLCVLCVSAS